MCQTICIQSMPLQERRNDRLLELFRECTLERETLTIAVINGTESFGHCQIREVVIGSNMQLLVGDRTVSSQISLSLTGPKGESMGPSYTAKVGGSHERECITSGRLLFRQTRSHKNAVVIVNVGHLMEGM